MRIDITHQAPNLYPDYYVIPFKKKVVSPYKNAAPDLVFIAKDYKDWYIVEVEMAYHDFDTHIEPQIQKLASANYEDKSVVQYICKKSRSLDQTKIRTLIHEEPVRILLILNEMNENWAKELKNKYGVITSVCNIFQSSSSPSFLRPPYRAYGISHNYPIYSLSLTTTCTVHPYLSYLGIDDNSKLNLKPGDSITLEYNNYITFWKGIEGPGKPLWLQMQGRDEFINRKKTYQITKLRDIFSSP